jgi:hypothetical protein
MDTVIRVVTGPLALEAGTFAVMVVVLGVGLVRRGRAGRAPAKVALAGLVALSVGSWFLSPGGCITWRFSRRFLACSWWRRLAI